MPWRLDLSKLLLKDVFTPGGQPSVTYVGREHLDLEGALNKALNQGYALNVVTGPTKSGKTVLCTRVLASVGNYVSLEGGQIRSEADFWSHLAYKQNIAQSVTKESGHSESTEKHGGLSGGLAGIAHLDSGISATNSNTKSSSASYENVHILSAIDRLIDNRTSLLIDDFHYIPSDVQKNIIQAFKGPIYRGLSVILLAVPHRAFDPITVEDEMQGRFRHIAIPEWSEEDLMHIPKLGFNALNVKCPKAMAERICRESFANPLLVQEICSELCATAGIFERCDKNTPLGQELLEPTMTNVADSKGFPKYRKLREGPQSRKDRQPRQLKEGGATDIYEAILMALARLGPQPRTHYDELRAALRDLIEEGRVPQKNEVTAALSQMSRIAREKIEGEPPLEFVKDEDALVITDPFLLFFMKWQKKKSQN